MVSVHPIATPTNIDKQIWHGCHPDSVRNKQRHTQTPENVSDQLMSTASSSFNSESSPSKKLSRVPAWIPFAAFAGTSIALAIPIVMLARRRQNVLRKSLSNSAPPPPPRRTGSGDATRPVLQPRPTAPVSPQASTTSAESSSKSEFTMPGTGELLSAIGKSDLGNALYAGKALAIATGIVTVGAATTVVGVKTFMGVNDTREFAEKARMMMWRAFPGLTSVIHRPPSINEAIDDHHTANEDDSEKQRFIETWSWPDAEKRLQLAWDQGGFAAWARVAMQELEAELHVERTKRLREYKEAQARSQ